MEIYSITFSPTGTSAKIAESVVYAINEVTSARIHHCDITHITVQDSLRLSKSDIAVIAMPVYGGRMASLAKDRMKNIRGDSTPCVLISVYGNRAFENALCDMAEFVGSLGFIPVAAGAFIGEHSYSRQDTPIAVGRPDQGDIAEAFVFGRSVGNALKNGMLKSLDVSVLHDESSPEQSMINFRNFVRAYSESQKANPIRLLPEFDSARCIGCGKCVEVCPTDAIAEDLVTIDSAKCIKCSACVKICPTAARSLSSPFALVLSENFSIRKSPIWIVG